MFSELDLNSQDLMNLEGIQYFDEPKKDVELVIKGYETGTFLNNGKEWLKVECQSIIDKKWVKTTYSDDKPEERDGATFKNGQYHFKQLLRALGLSIKRQDGQWVILPDLFGQEGFIFKKILGKRFIADIDWQKQHYAPEEKRYMKCKNERPIKSGLDLPDGPPPQEDAPFSDERL